MHVSLFGNDMCLFEVDMACIVLVGSDMFLFGAGELMKRSDSSRVD